MPRYTMCPFYIDENKLSISCEDAIRSFESLENKGEWMDQYCDKDWSACEYAQALSAAYDQLEKGDSMALEKEKIEALEKELKGTMSKHGRAIKKIEARDAEIRKLRDKNHRLEDLRKQEYSKRRKAERELELYQKHEAERIYNLAVPYEDRMAYLMDTYTDGVLRESDVEEWAKGKEFALTYDGKAEDTANRVWKVVTREAKDDAPDDRRVPGPSSDEEN